MFSAHSSQLTVRNDIDEMKVGSFIKDKMLDDSCSIKHS